MPRREAIGSCHHPAHQGDPDRLPQQSYRSGRNPPGLLEIAEIAAAHDLVVISDELYDQLVYGVPACLLPRTAGMCPRTILLGGFSKNYAMTGWRIGFAAAPAS